VRAVFLAIVAPFPWIIRVLERRLAPFDVCLIGIPPVFINWVSTQRYFLLDPTVLSESKGVLIDRHVLLSIPAIGIHRFRAFRSSPLFFLLLIFSNRGGDADLFQGKVLDGSTVSVRYEHFSSGWERFGLVL